MTARPRAPTPLPTPTGLWLLATTALHRPVPVAGPYPHVCGAAAVSPRGVAVRLSRRDCGACLAPPPSTTGPDHTGIGMVDHQALAAGDHQED